jgi:hypothetical protein
MILKLIIIFVGILMIAINLTQNLYNTKNCPKNKTIYKYIPRSFKEEQENPAYVSDIFKTMFTEDSVWVRSINDIDKRKLEQVNSFFISQI